MIVDFIILAVIASIVFYKWSVSTFSFFEKRGIPFEKPFPLVGNLKDIVLRRVHLYDHITKLYQKFDTRVFGLFDQRVPVYVIRDPSLLKQITVKEFDHFINHRSVIIDQDGGLFGKSLVSMRDDKWKDMRSTLSPVFTGSKMRQMFILIDIVAKESMDFLKTKYSKNEIDFNIKDYFTLFTNDVIASAVFGLQVNSFKDEKNEFYLKGKKVTQFTAWQNMKILLYSNFKYIMKLFKVQMFDKKDTDYFLHLVMDSMRYREKNKIFRPDMVNMMMEAKGMYINKDEPHKPVTNRQWTDEEIVAQFVLFFLAGFETSAVLMSFISHELMQNQDVQDKLRQEILEVKESLDGKSPSYETLQGMKYMDMVVSETLRRWPPAVVVDRQCNKDFTFTDGGIEHTIKAGEYVWIPIGAYHLEEKFHPNPLKFDPERFSDENKGNIQPYTYIPFGMGPRNCIGNRFALLETKAILFYLLSEFQIEASPKTAFPLELNPSGFNLAPKKGFWLKLVPLPDAS